MKNKSKWMSFVLILAFLMLTGAKCEDTHPSAPQPAPPPQPPKAEKTGQIPDPREGDPEPHPRKIVIFRAKIPEKNLRPYTVHIVIPGVKVIADEPIVGEEFNTRILVPEGYNNYITFEVKPARPGSQMGFCAIEAGNQHDGPRFIAGGWRAFCSLTLKT